MSLSFPPFVRFSVPLIWVVGLSACVPFGREPSSPLPTEWYRISGAKAAESTLLVMLPGRRSGMEDFAAQGLIGALKPEDRIDVVAADLHLGYYQAKTMALRLKEDVIDPARKQGYRRIEILGISLGGLGGLIYSLEYPGEVDRLTLLAPFVGDDGILKEIESSEGLLKWEPGEIAEDDFERKLWAGLQGWRQSTVGVPPEIRIGVGEEDRHRVSNVFFSRELLGESPRLVPGGHDWDCWRVLFREFYRPVSAIPQT